jgi:hypothetical protein
VNADARPGPGEPPTEAAPVGAPAPNAPPNDPSRWHPVERALAVILDEHGIRWEYEPHLFPLEVAADGTVIEAVAPDFYLPDLDVYLECTVMRQSRTTRKNRKLRKLAARHGVVATILYRRDFERLRDEYGLLVPLARDEAA